MALEAASRTATSSCEMAAARTSGAFLASCVSATILSASEASVSPAEIGSGTRRGRVLKFLRHVLVDRFADEDRQRPGLGHIDPSKVRRAQPIQKQPKPDAHDGRQQREQIAGHIQFRNRPYDNRRQTRNRERPVFRKRRRNRRWWGRWIWRLCEQSRQADAQKKHGDQRRPD